MKAISTFLAVALLSLYSVPAGAVALTFDDITTSDLTGMGVVPDHYQNVNLTWTNFGVINKIKYNTNSGYNNGIQSPNQLAYNKNAQAAYLSSSNAFAFNGGSFVGAWRDNMWIALAGFDKDGNQISGYTKAFQVNTNSSTSVADLNWLVYSVKFISYGGVHDPELTAGYGAEFGVDNLRIAGISTDGDTLPDGYPPVVPLPAAFPLFAGAVMVLGGIAARKRKA